MKMSGDEMGMVPPQPGLNSQLLFQDDPLRFHTSAPRSRVVGDSVPEAREAPSGFLETRYFPSPPPHHQPSEFRHGPYADEPRPDAGAPRNWSDNNDSSGDGSDGNDEDEDDGDDDEVDEEEEALVGFVGESNRAQNDANGNKDGAGNNNKSNCSGGVVKLGNGKTKFGPLLGTGRVVVTDGSCGQAVGDARGSCSENHHQRVRIGNFENAVTIAEPDGELYCSQYLRGEGSGRGQKDAVAADSGCGFSGRKDGLLSSDSGESLKHIFSDPLT